MGITRSVLTVLTSILLIVAPVTGIAQDAQQDASWPGPPVRNGRQSYFGLNGTKIFHIPEDADKVNQRIGWMRELGVHWDRIDMWWHVVEPTKGEFDWSRPDHCLGTLEKAGIQWYPILCYGAGWFPKDEIGPQTDEDFELYQRYVEEAVSRYKGRVPEWEVWNEPNVPDFWRPNPNPTDYTRLLKGAYTAIKKADPDARVAAPAIAPLGAWDRKFVERMYQLGAKDSFDVFDYHYYRNHEPEKQVPAELAEIRAVMHRYGDEKPIHISESGVSSIHEGIIDQERQAALVVRNQLLALALGVERFYYFDLQNWRDTMETWDGQLGLVTAAGERKPSFHAYRTLVGMTDYKDFVGRVLGLGSGIHGVLVRDPETEEYTLAVWLETLDAEATITLEVASLPTGVRLVHPDGTEDVFPANDASASSGRVYVEVMRAPRYVRGVDPMAYLPDAGVGFAREHTILAPAETVELGWRVSPLLRNPMISVQSIEAPDGISWDAGTRKLSIGTQVVPGLKTLAVHLTVEHGDGTDRRQVVLTREATIEITRQVELAIRPFLEGGRLKARLQVSNQSARRLEGMLNVEEAVLRRRPRSLGPARTLGIEAGQAFEHEVELPTDEIAAYTEPAEMRLHFGVHRSPPFRIHPVPLGANGPEVDGDLSDWAGIPEMAIDDVSQFVEGNVEGWSRETASARARVWLTPDALNFAATARDSSPVHNPHPAGGIWRGDSYELFVGLKGPTTRAVIDKDFEYQIGIAPQHEGDKGPVVFWFHVDKVIDDAKVAVAPTGDGWIIEASIPWSAIGAADLVPAAGDFIALDVKYNDGDPHEPIPAGNTGGRRLVWNGTASNWIDSSKWGMGVVKEE